MKTLMLLFALSTTACATEAVSAKNADTVKPASPASCSSTESEAGKDAFTTPVVAPVVRQPVAPARAKLGLGQCTVDTTD